LGLKDTLLISTFISVELGLDTLLILFYLLINHTVFRLIEPIES
jgi:hypothetical protein